MRKAHLLFVSLPLLFFSQQNSLPQDSLAASTVLAPSASPPQINARPQVQTHWYGWVRTEYSYDSRELAYAREYQLNLFPLDFKADLNGEDIHAAGSSNYLSITSRVGVRAVGPKIWGAKSSANLEADFFGNTELNRSTSGTGSTGLLRLRQANLTLEWPSTRLLVGQSWYPSYVPEVSPGVASFNGGILFNPFGWATQLSLSQKLSSHLSVHITAYKDREFQAPVVEGASSNSATYNSLLPTFSTQLQYQGQQLLLGVGAELQNLQPVKESRGYKSSEKLHSPMFYGYLRYQAPHLTLKTYALKGENLHHLVMLGGIASYRQLEGPDRYQGTKTSAVWMDASTPVKKTVPGVFLGYSRQGGTDPGYAELYLRGGSTTRILTDLYRASARVEIKEHSFLLVPEIEYTVGSWEDTSENATGAGDAFHAGSLRLMARVMYSF